MSNHRIFALKYLSILTLPLAMYVALTYQNGWTFFPFIYVFGLIPTLELLLKPDERNMELTEEALIREDPFYDWLIYATLPIQLGILFWFLQTMESQALATYERVGLILSTGIMCGTFGINVGHELGHRAKPYERVLAKIALASSLYMHFFIEHNRGHHKRVATPDDPATARYGETILTFWFRSITFSFVSAWKLEAVRLKKKKKPFFSFHNEMIWYMVIQGALLVTIALVWSLATMLYFTLTALVGILLLETVNYIEHYGLVRKQKDTGKYERPLPHHSWNSNHVIGRLLLFELSRHSDHHYQASRKYQILRHHENSPQMPTGYPGMIVMALFPPLWFKIMHRQIDKLDASLYPELETSS